jgi:gluconokinase
LTILPFWAGERSPTWPADTGGTITGLTYATTALDLLQAAIESTYHRLAQIADLMETAQKTRFEIIVSGGIRHSPESLQRLAHVLGRPIRPCAEPEASLRGAAVFALQRLGAKTTPLPLLPIISPRPTLARRFQAARLRQTALEQRMSADLKAVRAG